MKYHDLLRIHITTNHRMILRTVACYMWVGLYQKRHYINDHQKSNFPLSPGLSKLTANATLFWVFMSYRARQSQMLVHVSQHVHLCVHTQVYKVDPKKKGSDPFELKQTIPKDGRPLDSKIIACGISTTNPNTRSGTVPHTMLVRDHKGEGHC